jgi:hypothetical protein
MPLQQGQPSAPAWAVRVKWSILAFVGSRNLGSATYLVHHTDNEALLLDLVRLHRVLILENLACAPLHEKTLPSENADSVDMVLTRVNELQQLRVPAALLGESLFDRGDLPSLSAIDLVGGLMMKAEIARKS